MTDYVDAWPTARKRHRCGMCRRWVERGEAYWRQAGFDAGSAWTNKTCGHCERVVFAYGRSGGDHEWELEWVLEWLEDEHPAVFAALLAGWRFPDGELAALPFASTCIACVVRVEFRHLWCPPCDDKRIARIGQGFRDIAAAFEDAKA